MKKTNFTILGVAFLCIVLFTLTACENFLKGEKVSNEIKYSIAYNNAPVVKVNLYCNDDMGTLYPNNFYNARLGFNFRLQFIPNKEKYTVANPDKLFEAVNIKDNSKSMADYVQLTPIPQTENDKAQGVYYYNVKILKKSDDIRIRPINDSEPPVFKTLRIARTKEDAIKGTNLISMDNFTHYADNQYYNGDSSIVAQNIQNHHVNKIWVYYEAEDSGSGIDYIEVKEQLIYTIYADKIIGYVFNKITTAGLNCFYNTTSSKNFKGCFEYNFKTNADGVVNISFTLFDHTGNNTDFNETIDLIKDTNFKRGSTFESVENKYIENYVNPHKVPYDIKINLTTNSQQYAKDINGIIYEDTFVTKDENDFSSTGKIISFEYGYDEKNMTTIDLRNEVFPVVEVRDSNEELIGYKKEPVVHFEADPYRTIYIKATFEDTAGNISKSSVNINPIPDTVSVDIAKKSNLISLNFLVTNEPKHRYIRSINNSLIETNGSPDSFNCTQTNYNSLPDTIIVSHINNFKFSGKPLKLQKCKENENSSDNDFWCLVSDSNNTPELTVEDIPPFTVTVTHPINVGKHFVQVNWSQNFNYNSDYYYLIKYKQGSLTTIQFENNFQLDWNNNTPAKLYIVVCNKYGTKLESAPYPIDCSYDNIPPSIPEITIQNVNVLDNSCRVHLSTTDGISQGTNHGNSGIKIIKYLFSEVIIDKDSIDWNNNQNIKSTNYIESQFYTFDYSDTFPYCITIYAEDNNGNYVINQQTDCLREFNIGLVLKYDSSSNKLIGYASRSINAQSLKTNNYFLNGNKWEPITASGNEYGTFSASSNSENSQWEQFIDLSDTEELSFMKIIPYCYRFVLQTYTFSVDSVFYCYPPFLDPANELVCDLKDYCYGNAGINIFADQPCFAHTMYSKKNQGNKPEYWFRLGVAQETGLVMKKKSFTYTYDNLDEVPEGCYYTTIIHFADGTMMMTPVQLMQ